MTLGDEVPVRRDASGLRWPPADDSVTSTLRRSNENRRQRGASRRPGLGRALRRTLGTTLALQAIGLVSGALVARMLGVTDRGVLAALILWPSLIANVGDLGGPTAIAYLSARKSTSIDRLQGTALFLVVAQSAMLAILGIPVLAFGLARYSEYLVVAIGFLLIYLPLNLVARYANALNQGTGLFGAFNVVRLTVQCVYVLGIGVLSVTGSVSVRTVLSVALISTAAAAVVAIVGRYRHGLAFSFDKNVLRSTVRYGPRAQLGILTPVDSLQLDLAAVVILSSAAEAGYYVIAIAAAMIVRAHGTSFGMVALGSVGGEQGATEQRHAAAQLIRLALLPSCVTATAVILTAPIVVPAVYGGAFSPAVPVVQILTVGMLAASVRQVLGDCLRGLGHPARASSAEVVSLLVALPLFTVLVPHYGSIGAATAATGAYAAAFVTSTVFLHRLGLSMSSMFVVHRDDLAQLYYLIRPSAGTSARGWNGR